MKQSEAQQLKRIAEQLDEIRAQAPDTSTYRAGRIQLGIAQQLLPLVRELRELIGEPNEQPDA